MKYIQFVLPVLHNYIPEMPVNEKNKAITMTFKEQASIYTYMKQGYQYKITHNTIYQIHQIK